MTGDYHSRTPQACRCPGGCHGRLDRDVVGTALCRHKRHAAVEDQTTVVVRRIRNQIAVGIVNAPKIGIDERAVFTPFAPQVDRIGRPRHKLDREPVAVTLTPDLAPGRTADRNPSVRGRIRGKILSFRLRDGLRGVLLPARVSLIGGRIVASASGSETVSGVLCCSCRAVSAPASGAETP